MVWNRPEILLASITINILSLALPLAILQLYDRIIPNQAEISLTVLMAILAAAILISTALGMLRAHANAWTAARFEHAVGCRAVDRLLQSDLLAFERETPGNQLERLQAVESLRGFYAGQCLVAMADLPFVFVFIAAMWLIGGPLVFVQLIMLALMALCGILAGSHLRAKLDQRSRIDRRRLSYIIEVLGGILTVKGLAAEPLMVRRYERLQASSAEAVHDTAFAATQTHALGMIFANATMVLVAAAGSLRVIDGAMTVGMLAACTLLAGRSAQPLLRIVGSWSQFQRVRLAEADLRHILSLPMRPLPAEPTVPETAGSAPALAVDRVSFRYPGSLMTLFEDLDLEVAHGEAVAIHGESGSGKTTLLHLARGLIRPDRGEIAVANAPVEQIPPPLLRDQVAYLPQKAVLFRGTILDNLTMFEGERRLDEAMRLSHALGLDRFFARLPDGLSTQPSGGSVEVIADGVRQGIAIVRALVRQPALILFDEANTAFDMDTDRRLKALLAELQADAGLVLVSHRPSLVALADRRLTIMHGRLCEAPVVSRQPAARVREAVPAPAPALARAGR